MKNLLIIDDAGGATPMARSRRRTVLVAIPLLALALAACGGYWLLAQLTRPAADSRRAARAILPADEAATASAAPAEAVDVEPHEMPRIEPGTKIEPTTTDAASKALASRSHLVLHGVPRVAEGAVQRVPASLARLVSLYHLTILADEDTDDSSQPPRYRLGRVAIGLAADVAGRETIVSTKTLRAQGADFGFVERSSLAGNEACLDQALQVARTPTMLVFDATAIQRIAGKNRHVLHRHAVLVLPADGRLSTFVWALAPDEDGRERLVGDQIRLLDEGVREDRKLYVDSGLFVLGVPAQEAFALVDLPPGDDLPVSDELRAVAETQFKKPEEAIRLEQLLREAVKVRS
jgi:hypothetical protein